MKSIRNVACILGVGAGLACGGADGAEGTEGALVADGAGTFDVNDVSFLFPLGPDGIPRPEIKVDGARPLLTGLAFASMTAFALSGSEGVVDRPSNVEVVGKNPRIEIPTSARRLASWRVVAMRFDPCAPGALALGFSDPRCIVEMRLVAQPFVDGRSQDIAAHLIYNLGFRVGSDDLVKEAVKDLQAIKSRSPVPTTGEPLGVHPGLSAELEAGRGDLGAMVASFVEKYAAKAKDIELAGKVFSHARLAALMIADGDYTKPAEAPEWYFMAGEIEKDEWTPSELTPVGAGVRFEKLSFRQKQTGEGGFAPGDAANPAAVRGHFLPRPIAQHSIDPLFSGGGTNPQMIRPVDDPTVTSVPKVDCVSCHTATQRSVALEPHPLARVASPPGLTALVRRENLQTSLANTRNFGYFGTKPTVSMRVLNETLAVASYLDTKVLGAKAGPSTVTVDDKLWKCCMNGGGAGCERTLCATPDLPRRKVEVDPSLGDPCHPDTSAPDSDPRTSIDVSADRRTATLHGNDAACLALSMNGNFFSDSVDIECMQLDLCSVRVKTTGSLTGDVAKRLRNDLYQHQQSGAYTAVDGAHKVTIGCDDSCTIGIE